MTTITEPSAPRFQAILIKGHLKLMSKGLTHSSISKTQMLKNASNITGKTYKRGQYEAAINDLNEIINEGSN